MKCVLNMQRHLGGKNHNKTNPELKANKRTENIRNYFEKLHSKSQFSHQELDCFLFYHKSKRMSNKLKDRRQKKTINN